MPVTRIGFVCRIISRTLLFLFHERSGVRMTASAHLNRLRNQLVKLVRLPSDPIHSIALKAAQLTT